MRKTVVCHVHFSIVHIFLRFPFHRVIWTRLQLLYGDGAAFLTCRLVNLWDYCKIFSPIRKEEFRRRLGHLGILETKHTESWLSQTHLSVINHKIFCYYIIELQKECIDILCLANIFRLNLILFFALSPGRYCFLALLKSTFLETFRIGNKLL